MALKEMGVRDKVKVIIGGGQVDEHAVQICGSGRLGYGRCGRREVRSQVDGKIIREGALR